MSEQVSNPAPVAEGQSDQQVAAPAQEGKGQVTASQAQKAVDSAKQNANGTYTLKVNGQTKTVSEAEMKRLASLAAGAYDKFEQASKMQKEAQELQDLFKKSPLKALQKMGMSPQEARKFMEEQTVAAMEEDYLSPEQRRIREYEAKLAEIEEQRKLEEQEQLTKKEQEQLEREYQALEKEVTAAFEGSKLPPLPFFKSWAVDTVRGASAYGADLSFGEAVQEVEHRFVNEVIPAVISQLGPKGVESLFGKEFMKELRKADVAEIKAAGAPFAKPQSAKQDQPRPAAASKKTAQVDEPMRRSDFFNKIRGVNYRPTK